MVKHLLFLAIGMFAIGCNTFQIAGILPQISHTIGHSIAVTGLGISAFSLTYLLSAPLFSVLFAKKPVKRTIQLALGVFILGNLITFLCQDIGMFIIGRSIAGTGAGMFMPLCITIAIQVVNDSAKGRALSFVWGANSAGVVFGTPISVYLSSCCNWQLSILYIMTISVVAFIGFSLRPVKAKLPEPGSLKDCISLFGDKKALSVIGISCVTASASLGLYSYIAPIQAGSPNTLTMMLLCWGLGGFIGSSLVGTFIDRTNNPQLIMATILAGLGLTIMSIPFTQHVPFLGLFPIFVWGMFGWATTNPQQQILFNLNKGQGAFLAAMNSSALGLGSALGTMLGGLIITTGFKEINLPFLAAMLLFIAFSYQIVQIRHTRRNISYEKTHCHR